MSYFPQVLGDTEVPAFRMMQDAMGFIPNFYRAQTMRVDLIEAEVQLMGTILLTEGALTRQQKEYIFLVCSAENLSTYCLTAHCEIVRMLGIQGPEPEQVALNHTATNLPVPFKALLNFAAKLNQQPARVSRRDIDVLHTYGHTDQQIMEAVVTVGFAKFANLVAFGLGTAPDFNPSQTIVSRFQTASQGAG